MPFTHIINSLSKRPEVKEDKLPLVSVIIPVFNGAAFLEESVRSVFKSSYKKIEVILIDDGSTDRSRAVCRRLKRKYRRVRFYSFKRHRGLGRVLNSVLEKAKGELICRLNQDDIMLAERIETQVKFLRKNQAVVAVGSAIRLFDVNGHEQTIKFLKKDKEIKKFWLIVSPFADPAVMYRKQAAIKLGGYKQEFWPADDTHLWLRMGKVGKLANIDKPLVKVRYHRQAASLLYFRKLAIATYKMHRWMHQYIEPAPFLIRLFWIGQLIASLIFTADFNWKVYRLVKKLINQEGIFSLLTIRTAKKKITKAVNPQPIKLNLSGQ